MSEYYFYMWRHPYTGMTCYGITGNPEQRLRKYEGHNGFEVNWSYLIGANESTIRELEKKLKNLIVTKGYACKGYEWILADVGYDSIEKTVEYLLQGAKIERII